MDKAEEIVGRLLALEDFELFHFLNLRRHAEYAGGEG
jgi:hypothetical protein